jgi:hypothetical protein
VTTHEATVLIFDGIITRYVGIDDGPHRRVSVKRRRKQRRSWGMCSRWRQRWLGSHRHGFLYARESRDDRYINAHKELYQLAEDNGEIETRQIDIKIKVVRFFGLHLRHVQQLHRTRRYVYRPREFLTSSGKRVYRATLTWACRPARAFSQA